MADYDQFKHGAVPYPLTASTSNSLLKDADPALYYAMDFFANVLTTYLAPRLLAEASKSPPITAITAMVAAVLPMDPTPFLLEQQFKFPLLAVYRKKEKFVWKANGVVSDAGEWGVDYILPPMTGGQMERISPILRSVGQVISNRIENCMDPAYENGLAVWSVAGLEEIWLEEASYGGFAGTGNLVFPAWRAKLTVKEADTYSGTGSGFAGLLDLDGIDNETDLVDTPAVLTTLENVVDTQSDF